MKTLYININGEDIQNTEDVMVVGTPDDNIVDKFYYELGKEIVKGVDIPGVRGLDKKEIVRGYKDIGEKSFDKITEQWIKVKDRLLSEDPTGSETIELPMEYVKWLQNYGDTSHTEIAKSLYARDCLVEISIDKIYRNAIGIIINSIEPDNYGQFIVNDEAVTDDSAISIAIMKKFDDIAFKPYKKDVCPKCGKNPCKCVKIIPKCGKTSSTCNSEKKWSTAEDLKNGLIILEGITLNKTTIKELRAKGFKCERQEYYQFIFDAEINKQLSVSIPQCRYKDIDEIKNEIKLSEPVDIDDEFFINEGKVVKMMTLEITSDCLKQGDCQFFRELGMVSNADDFDYDEFIEMLEDLGYTKVENPFEYDDDTDDYFVNNIQNTNDWVIVRLHWSWDDDDNSFTITISFDVCFLNELVSYNTGKVLKRGVHRRTNREDDD